MMKRTIGIIGTLAILALAGCQSDSKKTALATAPTPADFTFATTSDRSVHVTVYKDGSPAEGVTVKVLGAIQAGTSLYESRVTPGLYLNARTDSFGAVQDTIIVPIRIVALDIVVLAPDFSGSWTDETLRDELGPFAPASRITVPVDELDNVAIDLEENP